MPKNEQIALFNEFFFSQWHEKKIKNNFFHLFSKTIFNSKPEFYFFLPKTVFTKINFK